MLTEFTLMRGGKICGGGEPGGGEGGGKLSSESLSSGGGTGFLITFTYNTVKLYYCHYNFSARTYIFTF